MFSLHNLVRPEAKRNPPNERSPSGPAAMAGYLEQPGDCRTRERRDAQNAFPSPKPLRARPAWGRTVSERNLSEID